MKRFWLIFSQAVTVVLAAYFVVVTLKPSWLGATQSQVAGVTVTEAPAQSNATIPVGSFRAAAQKASAAVVSINISKNASRHPQMDDPWFKFY